MPSRILPAGAGGPSKTNCLETDEDKRPPMREARKTTLRQRKDQKIQNIEHNKENKRERKKTDKMSVSRGKKKRVGGLPIVQSPIRAKKLDTSVRESVSQLDLKPIVLLKNMGLEDIAKAKGFMARGPQRRAYRAAQANNSNVSVEGTNPSDPAVIKITAKKRKIPKCWKCQKKGHKHKECVEPLDNKYCHNCGRPCETKKICEKCRLRYWRKRLHWKKR